MTDKCYGIDNGCKCVCCCEQRMERANDRACAMNVWDADGHGPYDSFPEDEYMSTSTPKASCPHGGTCDYDGRPETLVDCSECSRSYDAERREMEEEARSECYGDEYEEA